jgi:ATP-binding cassette subfamily C protein
MDLFLYFFRAYPRRTILVFIAVTVASIITAATLLLLPALLFTLLGRSSAKTQFINDIFTYVGIIPSTENLIILFLVGITLQATILAGANIYAGFTKAKVIKDLRIKLLTSMSQTEWAFFTKQSSGNFTASLVNEIESAGDGYETMVLILSNAVQILAYLSVAFFISWEIATIAIIAGIILTLLFGKLISISKTLGAEDAQLTRMITSQLTDSYRSIKPLKAMARESHSHAILNSYTKRLKIVAKKGTIVSELLDALQEIILMSTVIITIYYSFKHLNIPIEFSIILVILYLRSMKLFGKSQKQYQAYVGNISAYNMVMNSLHEATKHREYRTGTIKHQMQGNIEFKNISFEHGNKKILENASATFYHHKLNTIIGPSGEGKTTTADLICGLFLPTSGEILIDNLPLTEIDMAFWRSQIGYVTQENNLLNSSIKENITLGDPKFNEQDIANALKKAHCESFVAELPRGINTLVGENGAHLSGGQRQRILIARALVHSPKLIILDEATSALDSATEESLSKIFSELSKEITIISISHRPAIKNRSDYVLTLSERKLKHL